MSSFKQPNEYRPTNNPAENWEKWRRKFMLYHGAAELSTRKEEQQKDILLHVIGDIGVEILDNMAIAIPDTGKVTYILDQISLYYKPYRNTTFTRYTFFTATQGEATTIDQFVAELCTKAKDCEFGNLCDSLIRDRLICGIKDEGLRGRLLREGSLSLSQAIEICRAYEISKTQNKLIQNEEAPIHFMKHKNKNDYSNNKKVGNKETNKFKCTRCGTEHQIRKCPAFGKPCNKCHIPGHFAVMCKSAYKNRKQKERHLGAISVTHQESEEDDYEVMAELHNVPRKENDKDWHEIIKVNDKKGRFKLDTGSQINVLPKRMVDKLKKKPIIKENVKKIVSYSGHALIILGTGICQCITRKGKKLQVEFEIIDTELPAILGLKACMDLELIKRVNMVYLKENKLGENRGTTKAESIIRKYAKAFEGIGKLPTEYKIITDPEVKPQVCHPRRIPHSLQNKVKLELETMCKQDIIEKVNKPTKWVSPMLLKNKKSGGIRICLDPRRLNLAIQREHLQIPTQDELLNKVAGASVFTVLDAKSAFHQIKLNQDSSYLCTFATPFGRFRFKRMPFGIKSGPEVFQGAINLVTQDLEGTVAYFDDILVYGKNIEQHNERLEKLLKRATQYGLTFDKSKLQLASNQVAYLGHELTSEGIKIQAEKMQAIEALKTPRDKASLQRILGLVNYVSKFVPGMSSNTAYIRGLLKKNSVWVWDEQADEEFNRIKKLILNAPTLKFFNKDKNIVISADASKEGLGGVMMQEGKPVAFASASLTNAQRNYSQIEKELLAIIFSLKRFHYYVYGRQVTIQTDHKPLIRLQNKEIENMSPRIQRMIVMLQRYDTKVVYVPGKAQVISDPLSRDSTGNHINTEALESNEQSVHAMMSVTPIRLKELQELTLKDKTLEKIMIYTKTGWPRKKEMLPNEMQKYWEIRNDINMHEGLILKGQSIVIPAVEQQKILQKIHASHMGINACKNRARNVVYWPEINKDIEEYIQNCYECKSVGRVNNKQPLRPHPIPGRPWEKLGIDFLELQGRKYIIAIDYFSKYIEMKEMKTTTATKVIEFIKEISARHGIPNKIHTDNGPPFDGQEFSKFMKEWDSEHQTSSPLYAQANGMVERIVQTVKTRIKRMGQENRDINLLLLNYRTTPHNGLTSPAEALMGRKIRNLLPTSEETLKPQFDLGPIKKQLELNQIKQKKYVDRTAKVLPKLKIGQPVVFLHSQKEWQPGIVDKAHRQPESYIVKTESGKSYRRNRLHMKPINKLPKTKEEVEPEIIIVREKIDTVKDNQNSNKEAKGQIFTRSGRLVKVPARYRD